MPLVRRLTSHAEGLGNLGPRPPLINRRLYRRELESIREIAQGHHRSQGIGRLVWTRNALEVIHGVNCS